MIGTIIVILIILWLLGFSLGLIGSFIHILLVIAIILILLRIIQGRKPQPYKMKHTKDRFNSQKRITMRKFVCRQVSTDGVFRASKCLSCVLQMILKNSFSLTGISGEGQIALYSSRFMPLSRRGWSVNNLPFVKMAGFWVKITCFAIGDRTFTYHFRYKMVSEG